MENDRVETWLVEEPHGGDRIDRVLSFFLPEKSRSGIQLAIGEGRVTVNGVRCIKKNHLLRVGDEIAFRHVPPQSVEIEPQNIPLECLVLHFLSFLHVVDLAQALYPTLVS